MDNYLYNLIYFIKKNTKLHISVIFFGGYGNERTMLPQENLFHSQPICKHLKATIGNKRCFKCKNLALNKAIKTKKPFSGICINGIYEYCHPIINNDTVIGIIFIGNMYPPEHLKKRFKIASYSPDLLDTLETSFSDDELTRLGTLLEQYIKYLIENYPTSDNFNPFIQNIKSVIEENLTYNFSILDISKSIGYNEKYLGRLFKKKTDFTIKEYINHRRLEKAEKMLINTDYSVIEIATKIGYNNVTYFNRIFKKKYAVSPSEYRKTSKKQQKY